MITPTGVLFLVLGATMALVALLLARPSITHSRGGKVLAFVTLFILPVLSATMGTAEHIEHSKRTEFCLSCHIMHDYGRSLRVDDPSYLAAAHFQNNRVPRDQACYTCHTNYAMYGGLRSKVRGLRHVYVNYLGKAQPPLQLYTAYDNRECLHCHAGARTFEEGAVHNADPETLPAVKANQVSCMSSGCHDTVHNVAGLDNATFWEEPK